MDSTNIIEGKDLGADLQLCCQILCALKIIFRWSPLFDYESPDHTFIRGYDDYFLKVWYPKQDLISLMKRANNMKVFL